MFCRTYVESDLQTCSTKGAHLSHSTQPVSCSFPLKEAAGLVRFGGRPGEWLEARGGSEMEKNHWFIGHMKLNTLLGKYCIQIV